MANKRTKKLYASAINGIDAGGSVSLMLEFGYDQFFESSPDGLALPIRDRQVEYVRGTLSHQDWVHLLEMITATPSSYLFYERKSGEAAAAGYVQHTLATPIIHRSRIDLSSGRDANYAVNQIQFECKPALATDGFLEMWTQDDAQAAPTYIPAARGGIRIESAAFGASSPISIQHVTRFTLNIVAPLTTECNDDWVGYDPCEIEDDGLRITGSITFQDSTISTSVLAQRLVAATRDQLVLTVRQGGGAADKTITLAGVEFDGEAFNAGVGQAFNETTLSFTITNDVTTQLTLTGANKAIIVA